MAEQRPELRVDTDLPVRVFGMDANGKPLNQHVRARNISSNGALVSGIEQPLKVGDIIGVQREQKKARFRVVWVVDAGGIEKSHLAAQAAKPKFGSTFLKIKSLTLVQFIIRIGRGNDLDANLRSNQINRIVRMRSSTFI